MKAFFLDAMFFKVKHDNKVNTRVLYNIMGITRNDLKARGVEDMLIACVDGLKGFPEAINTAFPKTEVQQCKSSSN